MGHRVRGGTGADHRGAGRRRKGRSPVVGAAQGIARRGTHQRGRHWVEEAGARGRVVRGRVGGGGQVGSTGLVGAEEVCE
jgi:hypothetical protein